MGRKGKEREEGKMLEREAVNEGGRDSGHSERYRRGRVMKE